MNLSATFAWPLGAALAAGALVNAFAPRSIRQRYSEWGYSQRFRYIIAGLELAAAALTALPATRTIAAALAIAIMGGIIGSAVTKRQTGAATIPIAILLLALITTIASS